MKAATVYSADKAIYVRISIHAAREGGDSLLRFLACPSLDISIHAAREGGDLKKLFCDFSFLISIHAAREGGDFCTFRKIFKSNLHFNPRRP